MPKSTPKSYDNKKEPKLPVLDEDGKKILSWRKDISLWSTVTRIDKEERATHLYLALDGNAKLAAEQVDAADLKLENGLELLIQALEERFLPKKPMRIFNAYNGLRYVIRKPGVSIQEYILAFEHAKLLLENEGVKKDDIILALDLLSQCRLSSDKVQLVMSGITEITYENMKSRLYSVFFAEQELHESFDNPISDSASSSNSSSQNANLDTVLHSEDPSNDGSSLYTTGRGRRIYRGRRGPSSQRPSRGRSNYKRPYGGYKGSRRTNPIGRDGNPTTCILCNSEFHYARNCPSPKNFYKREPRDDEDMDKVHFNMFVGCTTNESNNRLSDLVNESKGYAILDSGCTNTVCGEEWLQNFIENLSFEDREKMVISQSDQKFTFGDGRSIRSKRKVNIPCWMGGKRGTLTTDVVDSNIPLLLSRRSMKRTGMILDFKNDTVRVNDRDMKLKITNTGHYALPLSL